MMAESRAYRVKYFNSIPLAVCSILIFHTASCYAVSVQQDVEEANKLYQKGKLDEALQKYNEANVAIPDSDVINFNMGAVLYKKEDYQKARDSFTKALTSGDKKIEADALYNLGNCKYKLGNIEENADLSAATALLKESLDYYKRAVEIDQKNEDARFNYEFVERELKVLLDKLKRQQSEKDKRQNQQEQKQEQKQSQNESSAGKEQAEDKQKSEQAAQAKEEQESRQKQEREKSAQAEEEQQKNKEGENQGDLQQDGEDVGARHAVLEQKGENKELSEEAARALLGRYGREEAAPDYLSADRQDMDKQTQRNYDSQVLKDW
ncbi:MAG: tetratricopeptide repeat protein [Candidatus Omnitrophota bacterium]